MSKRMIDNKIWQLPWFLDMSLKNKAIWLYIQHNCDYAGIWEIDVVDMKRKLKSGKIDFLKFIEEANRDYNHLTGEKIEVKRVMLIADNTKIWLTDFVSEQNEKGKNGLNPGVSTVKGICTRLKEEGILELAVDEGFIRLTETEAPAKGSEGLEGVTLINNNNNSLILNNREESVRGGIKEIPGKVGELYRDIWGVQPEDPEHVRLTESMLQEYGEKEVEFAFRTASKYQKKNPAYVEAICRKRKQKLAADKEIETARQKKLELQKQEMEWKKAGQGLGLLQQVYGEDYKKTGVG